MTYLLTAAAFVILITGLILIHEFGHFLVARRAGVIVEEFGFGLPPRLKTLFRYGGTIFSLNAIPFGGFVRLKGEGAWEEDGHGGTGSFSASTILVRCAILVAGVAMNLLLAFVLFTYGFSAGRWVPTYLSLAELQDAAASGEITLELQVLIEEVMPEGSAAAAKIVPGTVLFAVNGTPVYEPNDVVALQQEQSSVRYTVADDTAKTGKRTVTVRVEKGRTGVLLTGVPRVLEAPRRAIPSAVWFSLREIKVVTVQTVIGVLQLVASVLRRATVPEGVTGIVGIAQLTYSSVQGGWGMYLRLVGLLSLSLAVLNILPFPALDGGRLLFVLAEAILRRRASRRFEMAVNTVGFSALILLIILVTVYDVLRLFS